MSDFTEASSHHTSGAFDDEFDASPPSSVVSANAGYFSQVPRREHHLREFDLTEDFLQHFSREQRDRHTPPPNMPSSQTHFHPDVQTPTQDTAPGFFLSLPHLSHTNALPLPILLLLSQLIPGEMELDMDHLVLSYISLSQTFTNTPARTNPQVCLVALSPTQISHLHNTIQTPPPVGI